MIRKIFISLLGVFSMAVSAQEQKNVIDEVIWVVGDEAILRSDVENARMEALEMGQRLEGDPYCVIPEQLAVQKLFLHQAAIDSVEVSDAEVFQEVDMRLNAAIVQQFGSREKLEEVMHKGLSQIREQMFNSYKDKMLVEAVQRSLVQNIKVTPAQVRRYFKDMPEDSIPFIPTKVECQIITREPRIPIEEIERVKEELRDYTERVNNGSAQFSTLALLYSEDKQSAQQGGELFHIIQLIEKRGDLVNCRHILRKPRVSTEALQQCVNDLDSILAEIDKGLYTFDECVSLVSFDKDTRNNYGLLFDGDTGISKYEMKDLPSEVARAVAGMKVGEISKPFIMINKKGKEVVAIVKLKNRVNGHRATMAEDYQDLQNVVMDKLCEEKLENWIREKQAATYIHINDGWQNCEFQYPGWVK